MMANNYESLKTDGHYTLARRIFMKIKSWAEPKSMPVTWANYQALVNAGTDDPNVNYMIIDGISGALLDCFYPIGSYYETSNTSFDPNISFGGTWVLETEGLVHISSGSNYAVTANAQDGGSGTISYTPSGTVGKHTLVASEIPKFAGSAYFRRTSGGGNIVMSATGICARNTISTGNTSYNQIASSTVANQDQLNINFGGGGSHDHGFTGTQTTLNTMQPYKIVNRWHRTA